MYIRLKIFILLISIVVPIFCSPQMVNADDALITAQEIYYETLSPFCPGRALADCPTEEAKKLKERILKNVKEGKSKKDITNEIEQEYGPNLSTVPNMEGFNLLAWLMPIIAIIIGIVLILQKFFLAKKGNLP